MDAKISDHTGRWHLFRNCLKEKWTSLREDQSGGIKQSLKDKPAKKIQGLWRSIVDGLNHESDEGYSQTYRKKTRREMTRISAAVMGIEFCYAAETAFVSPTLLKIGVRHAQMTLIWCLSPFVGFFLTPILGSLSDNCTSILGRRRPFIILLSIGILLGLVLVPNGKWIGMALGDQYPPSHSSKELLQQMSPEELSTLMQATDPKHLNGTALVNVVTSLPNDVEPDIEDSNASYPHPWGIFFTILGTMLLDFDADACQSPSRAYLLDVTLPEDHAAGLSTFTIMAGLGGAFGYALGGINWDATLIGWMFGGHVRAVFTLVTFIFMICVFLTLSSVKEMPLEVLQSTNANELHLQEMNTKEGQPANSSTNQNYGATDIISKEETSKLDSCVNVNRLEVNGCSTQETSFNAEDSGPINNQPLNASLATDVETNKQITEITLRQYLLSIIYMPKSLRVLCVTNLFCWMSLVCYSLYFTDFVGEAVFGGDPMAEDGTPLKITYEEGVRFGCWGMALYSLSCSAYSFMIEKLVKRFSARPVYICGQLAYSVGMVFMAAFRHKAAVIFFSCSAGIMYSTLFTMPYLLVAHYHAYGGFDTNDGSEVQVRGLGTDVAIVSSMVFLAQFILSLCMGTIVSYAGSTTAVVCSAAFLAFCGAASATQVVYLDL